MVVQGVGYARTPCETRDPLVDWLEAQSLGDEDLDEVCQEMAGGEAAARQLSQV